MENWCAFPCSRSTEDTYHRKTKSTSKWYFKLHNLLLTINLWPWWTSVILIKVKNHSSRTRGREITVWYSIHINKKLLANSVIYIKGLALWCKWFKPPPAIPESCECWFKPQMLHLQFSSLQMHLGQQWTMAQVFGSLSAIKKEYFLVIWGKIHETTDHHVKIINPDI